jgi:hypothetical protein
MRNENGMFVSVGCFSGNEQRKSTLSIVSFNSAQSIATVDVMNDELADEYVFDELSKMKENISSA